MMKKASSIRYRGVEEAKGAFDGIQTTPQKFASSIRYRGVEEAKDAFGGYNRQLLMDLL